MRCVPVAVLAAIFFCGCVRGPGPAVEASRIPIIGGAIDCNTEVIHAHIRDLDEKDANGWNALHWAVERNCAPGLAMLLTAGANPNQRDGDWTPLSAAAVSGNAGIVKMLLEEGADVEVRSGMQQSFPLATAALNNKAEVAKLLIDHGALVTDRDRVGSTALHAGAVYPDIVRELAGAGADVNARDNAGFTPIMFAHTDWRAPGGSNGAQSIEILHAHGADVNARAADGETALMLAAYDRDAAAIEALLKAGADVNARDNNGRTALGWLRRRNEYANGLVAWVASVAGTDRKGRGAFERCERALVAAGAR